MNNSRMELKKPMTKKQVENMIQLATQNNKCWFEMRFVDDDYNNDPIASAYIKDLAQSFFEAAVNAELQDALLAGIPKGGHISGSH